MNFIQELQLKKQHMKIFAENAFSKNWLNKEDYTKILDKIDNDVLTIGVIGQMKSGKSTFLNSLLFGKEVLPAATTPMTAALSIITYGEEEKIEVEFYTPEEWLEIKMLAGNNTLVENDNLELASKIKASKELVNKSLNLGDSLDNFLGKVTSDTLPNLIEYVGANGKYVAITKSVTLYHPTEWLKGVRIVDTPGFNDPVVSREARTQEWLKSADVVVVLLYAGRAFDATDKEIIFERVRSVGMGKILIAINKYDLNYLQGETNESLVETVKDEIKKALTETNDPMMHSLLENVNPIPISAQMALLSKLPLSEINNSEDKKFHWDKLTSEFEISTHAEMYEKSLVKNLENALLETIEKNKLDILVKKPITYITKQGEKAQNTNNEKLSFSTNQLKFLKLNDDDLEAKIKELKKAQERIAKSVKTTITDLNRGLEDKLKEQHRALEDSIIAGKKEVLKKIENAGKFTQDKTVRQINDYLKDDLFRNIDYKIEDNISDLKNIILGGINTLTNKILTDVSRKVENPEELIENFENALKNIKAELEEDENDEHQNEEGKLTIFGVLGAFISGALIVPVIIEYFKWKNQLIEDLNEVFRPIINDNLPALKDKFTNLKKHLLAKFNTEALENILSTLIKELEQAEISLDDKNAKIDVQTNLIKVLEAESIDIKNQIREMNELKISLNL